MWRHGKILVALVAAAVILAGCDGFLEVDNPGGIQDSGLNDDVVFGGLVFGMEEDFGVALSEMAMDAGVMADEWSYVGNSSSTQNYSDGILRPDEVGGHWNRMQRARWVAEDGVRRMVDIWGQERMDRSELAVRARLAAGFANRMMGELFCEAIFDGGPAEPHTRAFEVAEVHFSEAARMAQAQGDANRHFAALGARATVRAWQGDWDGAAADAAQVPAEFSHDQMYWATGATFPSSGGRAGNWVWRDNAHRDLFTVAESRWADLGTDPRVPSDTLFAADGVARVANDGTTIFVQQRKYTEPGSDIPLVKGTEMLLLRAEARLRTNDVPGAMTLINQNRAQYGLSTDVTAENEAEAWQILRDHRAAEVWLEARRLWDLRRWDDPFLAGRDSCIPISERERITNPNLGE
jgi:starch-binding outer membrane protein, SusD/RagB family